MRMSYAAFRMSKGPQHRLAELRRSAGLTQRDVADRIKSPRNTRRPLNDAAISKWEMGAEIPDRYWKPLAAIFDVSIPFLLGYDNGPQDGGERKAA